METVHSAIAISATLIEATGVLAIIIAVLLALGKFLHRFRHGAKAYQSLRQELGRGILLGLEILVAGDIIATVVTEPTLNRIFALAIIVLIRTFLSWSIQLEIEGRFPWQQKQSASERTSA